MTIVNDIKYVWSDVMAIILETEDPQDIQRRDGTVVQKARMHLSDELQQQVKWLNISMNISFKQ